MIKCEFENGNKASLRHVTVAVIILKDGKILMGKRGLLKGRKLSEYGKWALIGGYVDRDETTAGAAAREVMEESGWKIKNLKLIRINDNPDRPHEDKQNIELCYTAEAVENVGVGDGEMSEFKWFTLDGLPQEEEIAFDHADDIETYKAYIRGKITLPVLGKLKA